MPPSQPVVFRSYIPWCYSNSGPVKKEPDKRLGAHRYSLTTKGGQFVVDGPRKLGQTEIQEIHERVQVHYHPPR
ncbi:hypothetical protein CGCSCA1_v002201 [Colletotrichum siamense]|nr:hypothetical protein CGCSCA1_v002201 [Colletotrichum siamense]